jgi:CHAT domain-containing protein/tetratricopeptide (TPR) repeat protein
MATFPRCLCVILTLWVVSSRPSASILPEESSFEAWWGTPDSHKIARLADKARRAGDISGAETYYRQGYDDAVRRHDERAVVGYLSGMAACRLALVDYRAALQDWLEAKRRAQSIHNKEQLGAIAVNLSTLYFQVYDFESAQREADEGRAMAATLRRPYFLPSLLLQLARLHEVLDRSDGMAESLYRESIQAAKRSGNKPLEALGLDLLGAYLLTGERQRQKLHDAEKVIEDGIHLRESFSRWELGLSWGWMGKLRLEQGDLKEAARFTDLALNTHPQLSEYLLKHQRGEIRAASGDQTGALADFEEAVELESRWRLGVLPTGMSLTSANEELEQNVFDSFIVAAAEEAVKTRNQRWAEKAFEAVELNRAANLRENLAFSEVWHRKVPIMYWETLSKLRIVDTKVPGEGPVREESRRLRLELIEMEAKAGLGFPAKNYESFHSQTSLIHFQQGLSESEVLLSFHLGDGESYLWAVTRKTLRVQKIAAEGEIRTKVLALENAVRAGRPTAVELGKELYRELFGQLGQDAVAKSSWLLSLEGILFEVPFAALVTERKDGKVSYLVSEHSVQTIPGALLLSTRPEAGTGWFLGVGDPIYNAADPRWAVRKRPEPFFKLFQTLTAGADAGSQLGRLVGTAQELSASVRNWGGSGTVLLEGAEARRDVFLKQLALGPSVIHLATHVIASSTPFIAFGLGSKGESEPLTMTDVASLRAPGAIVVMSGCDSGSGEVHAGAGLLGLTRAWQMAGASVVLATSWPVRDSTGDIFASFYRHLRDVPAAEALRLSQLEMLHSGTWRAAPAYWAPYQVSGGAR